MVLLKMLMEIDPLPMRESLVMTMAMTSPSLSPAEQLRWSPRLVSPRFRLVAAEFRLVSQLIIFSSTKDLIQQKMGIRRLSGAHEAGGAPRGVGRAPTLMDGGWPPSGTFFAQYFLLIPKITLVEFQDFWSCAEQVSNICSFSSPEFQLRHSPSSCKPCKIRENRHKCCDIMCNNNP